MKSLGIILALAMAAAVDIDGFFDTFAQKREGLVAVSARFTQENVTPDDVLVSEGELIYVEPRRILFRYFEPPVTYLVQDNRMYEYDAELEQVQIYDVKDQPAVEAMFLGLDKETSRLRESFELDLYKPAAGEPGAEGLMLLPKVTDEDETPLFQKARINLEETRWLPVYVRVDNDNESYFEIEISDYKYNDEVDLKKMFITLPEGTRIIENDELVEKVGPQGKIIPESKNDEADQ